MSSTKTKATNHCGRHEGVPHHVRRATKAEVDLNKCGFTPSDMLAVLGAPYFLCVFTAHDILAFFWGDPFRLCDLPKWKAWGWEERLGRGEVRRSEAKHFGGLGFGFGVRSSGFRVQGLGLDFRVQGLGGVGCMCFRVWFQGVGVVWGGREEGLVCVSVWEEKGGGEGCVFWEVFF